MAYIATFAGMGQGKWIYPHEVYTLAKDQGFVKQKVNSMQMALELLKDFE